jgi:H+-transporting ATPase
MGLFQIDPESASRANQVVNVLAIKGYQTLGVARAEDSGLWQFLGILPLFDPPPEDSAATSADAQAHGIKIKMVTGDNVAIGREIAWQLGLGANIQIASDLFFKDSECELGDEAVAKIERGDGYTQVFPEHKFGMVKALRARGHLAGMSGEGVNDAPAIKQADLGIAVSGATDAARAAADLVLTAHGLSRIVHAVDEARRILASISS